MYQWPASGGLGGANFGNFGLSSGFGNFEIGTKNDVGLNAGLAFGERGRGIAFGGGLFGGEVGSGDIG